MIAAAILATVLGGFGPAASALSHIPTVAGVSAFERLRSCHVRFQWPDAWIADDGHGTKILEVFFTLPRPPGDDLILNDILARWEIRGGTAKPTSNWAESVQNRKGRIGVNSAMPC